MSRRSSSTTVTWALTAMRDHGEVLTLAFEDGKPVWRLSSGHRISPRTAQRLVSCAGVQSAADALFSGMPAQTYRAR
jgi:hypothetical protein